MDLSEELTKAKKLLRPTETRVTTPDGMQYVEQRPGTRTLQRQSFSGRPPNLILAPSSCPGFVVDNKPDLHIGVITESILMGSADAAMDKELLEKYGVTHILTVAPLQDYSPPIPARHLSLNILDLPDTELAQYYNAAFTFIDDAVTNKGCVLIHCNAGVSRSAAITLAYLMKSKRLLYDTAFNIVKAKRPHINPNIGFIIQLKNYEKQLHLS